MLNDIFIAPFADMVAAPDFLMQVLWEGLVSGILYALIALGFVLIFRSLAHLQLRAGHHGRVRGADARGAPCAGPAGLDCRRG